jgi:hypothetical protein
MQVGGNGASPQIQPSEQTSRLQAINHLQLNSSALGAASERGYKEDTESLSKDMAFTWPA